MNNTVQVEARMEPESRWWW